ncbi:MAG: RecX family transcriptional regulator, partial [Oscillospiraceae bacterium]|nr:RecX family transcriptional regulator [Oscillospiraceae bacterium]
MVITKLTASKRVPGRFYVDFDDGATLRVPELVVSEYALYPERELDAAEYESVRAESETGLARQRALRVLGSRVMSRGEMEARLIKLGETEETAAETAEWLSDIGLIDDLEYARAIARGYSRRGYGSRRVRDELYKRRIPRGMWDEALA